MKKEFVTARDIYDVQSEVAVKDLAFRPSIYGVIIRDGSVLLTPQFDGWDFPGGGIDMGESLDEALEREIFEETGLSAKRDKLLHVASNFFLHPGSKKHYQTILMYFTCKDPIGEISIDGLDEHEKEYARMAEWVPIEKAVTFKFCNAVDSPALIRMALEGKGL